MEFKITILHYSALVTVLISTVWHAPLVSGCIGGRYGRYENWPSTHDWEELLLLLTGKYWDGDHGWGWKSHSQGSNGLDYSFGGGSNFGSSLFNSGGGGSSSHFSSPPSHSSLTSSFGSGGGGSGSHFSSPPSHSSLTSSFGKESSGSFGVDTEKMKKALDSYFTNDKHKHITSHGVKGGGGGGLEESFNDGPNYSGPPFSKDQNHHEDPSNLHGPPYDDSPAVVTSWPHSPSHKPGSSSADHGPPDSPPHSYDNFHGPPSNTGPSHDFGSPYDHGPPSNTGPSQDFGPLYDHHSPLKSHHGPPEDQGPPFDYDPNHVGAPYSGGSQYPSHRPPSPPSRPKDYKDHRDHRPHHHHHHHRDHHKKELAHDSRFKNSQFQSDYDTFGKYDEKKGRREGRRRHYDRNAGLPTKPRIPPHKALRPRPRRIERNRRMYERHQRIARRNFNTKFGGYRVDHSRIRFG